METPGRAPAAGNALGPLKVPVFRLLWVATILGNVGTFVRDVASAWLATDLGGGAVAVARQHPEWAALDGVTGQTTQMLLANGDRYEADIAINRELDAKYR